MQGKGGHSVASIVLKPDKLDVEYDKENDVLHISAGKPETPTPALSHKKAW